MLKERHISNSVYDNKIYNEFECKLLSLLLLVTVMIQRNPNNIYLKHLFDFRQFVAYIVFF